MFRPAKPIAIDKKRHVMLAIKTTGSKATGYDPADHRITQVACVEMKNGKSTGYAFEHVGDFDVEAQEQFLAFLTKEENTKLIVHYKKFVLDFLRHELVGDGKQKLEAMTMENMISKAAKLAKDGKYVEGTVPFEIEKDSQKLGTGRKFYQFKQVCEGMGVHTRKYTGTSAMQEAEMLAQAEYNRLQHKESCKLGMR